jgi:hypothetical protein
LPSREALRALLEEPVPHEIAAAADAVRQHHFGRQTTVAFVDHLDPGAAWNSCPVTGIRGSFAASLDGVSDRATDLILLPAPGSSLEDLAAVWAMLPERPSTTQFQPTVQLGATDTWIAALDSALADDATALSSFTGLSVVSDGIFPSAHPVRGPEPRKRWEKFWRGAAKAGLSGHATVLYGPGHELDAVFEQLDAIAGIHEETGVFLSVAPCIFAPDRLGDSDDRLTHASLDLRAWAACRLADTDVEHVSLRYERSDLKSAHTALRCGIDDLVGQLFLGDRDRKADSESRDLSASEVERWLGEVDMEMRVRNGEFDTAHPSEVLA